MSLNSPVPVSSIGPAWPGVQVVVTESGFQPGNSRVPAPAFNLGTHVGDDRLEVEARRLQLQHVMGVPITWLNQVHGCEVHVLDGGGLPSCDPEVPTADAAVTLRTDRALAIMTADCLPVLFAAFNQEGEAVGVAAAHAGWRGLHAGVLTNALAELRDLTGLGPNRIRAWMGPAIGPDSFEVGTEVREAFIQLNPLNSEFFSPTANAGKYLADLYSLARHSLQVAGVAGVEGGGLDTFTDSRWFSHRRSLQQGAAPGRFATLIRLAPAPVV